MLEDPADPASERFGASLKTATCDLRLDREMPEPWAHAIDRLHPESLKKPPQHVRRHGTVARNRGDAVPSGRSRPAAGNDP